MILCQLVDICSGLGEGFY